MIKLQKFIPKEILIRLTDDGFASTVKYCGLYTKSAQWETRPLVCGDSMAFVRPDEDDEAGRTWRDDG